MDDFHLLQWGASYAARHHRHQERDGETPYVSHPFRVCLTLAHLFGIDDAPTLCAALLHDLIEDTTVDYDDIAKKFGSEVAGYVAAMTKDMRLPEEQREAAYDEQIRSAPWQVRAIKLADAYDNLCDATTEKVEKAKVKAERAIACAGDDEVLAKGGAILQERIDILPELAVMERLWQEAIADGDESVEILDGESWGVPDPDPGESTEDPAEHEEPRP